MRNLRKAIRHHYDTGKEGETHQMTSSIDSGKRKVARGASFTGGQIINEPFLERGIVELCFSGPIHVQGPLLVPNPIRDEVIGSCVDEDLLNFSDELRGTKGLGRDHLHASCEELSNVRLRQVHRISGRPESVIYWLGYDGHVSHLGVHPKQLASSG